MFIVLSIVFGLCLVISLVVAAPRPAAASGPDPVLMDLLGQAADAAARGQSVTIRCDPGAWR